MVERDADVFAHQPADQQAASGLVDPVAAVFEEVAVAVLAEQVLLRRELEVDAAGVGLVIPVVRRCRSQIVVGAFGRNHARHVVRMRIELLVEAVERVKNRHLVVRERVAYDAAVDQVSRAGIVNLVTHGIELQQVGKIPFAGGITRHGAVHRRRLFRLRVLEAAVVEKKEELVTPVEQPGKTHRSADRTRVVVRVSAGLTFRRQQALNGGRVAAPFGRLDRPPVRRIGRRLRGVQPLLPVLPGERPVIIVRAALGHHADRGAGRMAFAGVERRGLDFEVRDRVGVGQVTRAAAAG